VGVGWWGLNPDDLRRLGFHQEHQVERRRWFLASRGFQQKLVADELDFVIERSVGRIGLGGGGFEIHRREVAFDQIHRASQRDGQPRDVLFEHTSTARGFSFIASGESR
jgi:hypothetical protein